MNLSFDEYGALVAKAFRGVGYAWGQTEDAAWAARKLADVDEGSSAAVLTLLDHVDGDPLAERMPNDAWGCSADALCPISVGTALLDLGCPDRLALGPTLVPQLLAPFMQLLVETEDSKGISIEWGAGNCTVTSETFEFAGERRSLADEVVVRRVEPQGNPEPLSLGRVILEESTVSRFEAYAHRVYAPATEASRDAGAGAGTLDND